MPPRAWHSGFRETVENVDPSLHPSDLNGTDDELDLFSRPPEHQSPSRTIGEETNTAFNSSLTNGVWRCLMCDSTSSCAVGRGWNVQIVATGRFTEVTDRQSRSLMLGCSCRTLIPPHSSSGRRRRWRRGHPAGSGSPDGSMVSDERAASEVPTQDPTVDPDAPRNQWTVQPNLPQPNVSGQQDLLRALRQLVTEKEDYDKAEWSSAKGPKPGIKWKGAAAPNPLVEV